MKKYKVAIIGCGGIANSKHMPALALNPQTEMVAFCDIIVERAEAAAKKYGTPDAKVYEDYRELLKDESIDNVHVCTPNRMHSVISVDALDAGKNVLSLQTAIPLHFCPGRDRPLCGNPKGSRRPPRRTSYGVSC